MDSCPARFGEDQLSKSVWYWRWKNWLHGTCPSLQFLPQLSASHPKFPECHLLICPCLLNLVWIACGLPELFPNNCFFLTSKSHYSIEACVQAFRLTLISGSTDFVMGFFRCAQCYIYYCVLHPRITQLLLCCVVSWGLLFVMLPIPIFLTFTSFSLHVCKGGRSGF